MSRDPLRCGAFELDEVIGRGGFAEVWSGRHLGRGVPVAVKIITSARVRSPRARAMLANEVRAVASLRHRGIVEVFDFGAVDDALDRASGGRLVQGSPYLVMEQLSGGVLSPVHVRSWRELRGAVQQVLAALAHAHARGLIHRDLKPGNVLADDDGRLRLTDWGIAHAIDRRDGDGSGGGALGTIRYMAPEQVRGATRDQGPWTDLYGLGCLIWRLASGNVPFDATSATAIAQHQLHTPPPPLEPTFAVPDGLDAVVRKLLAKDPADRYRRAVDVAAALDALDAGDVAAALAPPAPEVPVDWRPDPEAESSSPLEGAGLGLFGVRRVPVVGRDAHRDRVWQRLRDVARTSEPRAVVLRGEPGMGASRLAAWVCHHARERGVADSVFAEHGAPESPFTGLAPMLGRRIGAVGRPRPETLARVREHVGRQGVDDTWEWIGLTELIAPATADEVRAGAPVVRFASSSERHALVRRQLVREAADRPLIVWLDDAHDSPDSLRFARHVLQMGGPAPLLFVLTAVPRGAAPSALDALADEGLVEELLLEPLEERHQRRLVEELLGLEPYLARQIEDRTAGTPLFAVQLVADLVVRGVLVSGTGGFELAAGEELELPADVHSLLQARLDRIFAAHPAGCRRAVELAAALGRTVDRREWEAARARACLDVPPALLEELQERRLLERSRRGWTFPYRSVHESLLRGAGERGTLPVLHRIAAGTLQDLSGGGLPGLAARVAQHLLAAGDLAEAVPSFLLAAEEHRERGRPAAARALLETVDGALDELGAPDDDPHRAKAEILQARIAGHLTDFGEVCRRARPVVERARRLGWDDLLPEALRTLAFGLWQLGERERAESLYAEALPRFQALDHGTGVGRCNLGLGIAAAHRGEADRAEELFTAGLEAFERADDPRGLSDAYGWLGILANRRGDRVRATSWYQRALPAAERVGHRLGVAMIRNSLAVVARQEGRLMDAENGFRRSVQLAEAIGSGEAVWPRINLALVLMARRAFPEARSSLDRALSELEGRGRRELVGLVRVALAACAAAAGEWEGFDAHLEQASPLLGESAAMLGNDLQEAAGVAADLAAAAGHDDRAETARALLPETAEA